MLSRVPKTMYNRFLISNYHNYTYSIKKNFTPKNPTDCSRLNVWNNQWKYYKCSSFLPIYQNDLLIRNSNVRGVPNWSILALSNIFGSHREKNWLRYFKSWFFFKALIAGNSFLIVSDSFWNTCLIDLLYLLEKN